MYDWIALDGKKSTSLTGVVVMEYTPLYLPSRGRTETILPGRLTAVTQKAWQREPADVSIILAVVGRDQAAVHRAWREQVEPWLYHAARLTLDDAPEHFYRGVVTQVEVVEDENAWIKLRVAFRCNPPCLLRLLSPMAGWFPDGGSPIPKQMNDQNATVSAAFTGAGWMKEISYAGLEKGETYLSVTGTWKTLRLGESFEVLKAAEKETTLYIDGENAQVWTCEADGTEVNWMGVTTGEMPIIGPQSTRMFVGGEGIDVRVRLLVVEMGA